MGTTKKRRPWTACEEEYLRKVYPNRSNADLAEFLHRSPRAIQLKAFTLGIQKSPEYMESSGFKRNQFKKGRTPFNKGRSRCFWATAEAEQRMAKGQFKKGECRATNPNSRKNKPIGHERLYSDGYVWIITPNGRKQKHRWVWEQAHGPIPKDHCIKFRDGDTTNCTLENLYMVSRSDHARETRAAMTPEKKAEIMEKVHEGRKKSARRDRLRLKWGLDPEGKLIKRP